MSYPHQYSDRRSPDGRPAPGQGSGSYPAPQASGSYPTQGSGHYPAPSGSGPYPTHRSGQHPAQGSSQYPGAPGSGQYPRPGSGQYPTPGSGQYPAQGSGRYPAQRSGSYPAQGSGSYPAETPPGWYVREGVERWWDGAEWTEHVRPIAGRAYLDSEVPRSGSYAAAAPRRSRKGWYVAGLVAVVVIAAAALLAPRLLGGSGAKGDTAANVADSKAATQAPAPAGKWVTVARLAGSGAKQSGDFHLHGCDSQIVYTEAPGAGAVLNIYVIKSGKQDGSGLPDVYLAKDSSHRAIERPEGNYYIKAEGATDWTVTIQERC